MTSAWSRSEVRKWWVYLAYYDFSIDLGCISACHPYPPDRPVLHQCLASLSPPTSFTQLLFHSLMTGSVTHQQLCWMKHKITWDALVLGFNFITTDNDVAFMRRIWPSVKGIFEAYDGDYALVPLRQGSHLATFNPQNGFIKSNNRTIDFFSSLLGLVTSLDVDSEIGGNWITLTNPVNDFVVSRMGPAIQNKSRVAWRCGSATECRLLKEAGFAAVIDLPSFWEQGSCVQDNFPDGPCSRRRLFVHSMCGRGRPFKQWSLMNLVSCTHEDVCHPAMCSLYDCPQIRFD